MGYTHYWNFKKKPIDIEDGAKKFKKAVTLIKKGIGKIPAEFTVDEDVELFKLKGGNGTGKPIFNNDIVCFNGDAENNNDYEGCYIGLNNDDWSFDFCKTARKPYDVAVCLTLLCFKRVFGEDFTYSSDGNIEDWGWKMAHEIYDSL